MTIPSECSHSGRELTLYLLAPQVRDDKSKFLSLGGFSSSSPGALSQAIRVLNEVALELTIESRGSW
jgi:hypothetical protein